MLSSLPPPRVRPRIEAIVMNGALLRRSTRSVQIGTASSPSAAGRSAAAARSKWLMKKSGRPLLKTTTWMSGSSVRSATISCNRITVSATTRLTGAFVNVMVAICGVGRSRVMVLEAFMACLSKSGGLGGMELLTVGGTAG